jgi:hypothetical protein
MSWASNLAFCSHCIQVILLAHQLVPDAKLLLHDVKKANTLLPWQLWHYLYYFQKHWKLKKTLSNKMCEAKYWIFTNIWFVKMKISKLRKYSRYTCRGSSLKKWPTTLWQSKQVKGWTLVEKKVTLAPQNDPKPGHLQHAFFIRPSEPAPTLIPSPSWEWGIYSLIKMGNV